MRKAQILLASLIAVLLIGIVDYLTGPEFALTLIYLVPVVAVTWFVGRFAGAVFAVACAGVWLAADADSLGVRFLLWVDAWNSLIRLAFMVIVTELLSRTKRGLDSEAEAARETQRALLAREMPLPAGIVVGTGYRPARNVSGDYYDLLPADDETVLVVCIGDVAGKGLGAALLMANLQGSVRAFVGAGFSLGAACTRLNDLLCRTLAANCYVTFCIARIDPAMGRLAYVNAGHVPPLLVSETGDVSSLPSTGPVLGVFPAIVYDEQTTEFPGGTRLVLVTDGVTEALGRNGEEYGTARLTRLLVSRPEAEPTDLAAAILNDVRRFDRDRVRDDTTIVVVGRSSIVIGDPSAAHSIKGTSGR